MNLKGYLVAAVFSSLMWAGAFDVARYAYREGQEVGLVSNLYIVSTIREAFDDDDGI